MPAKRLSRKARWTIGFTSLCREVAPWSATGAAWDPSRPEIASAIASAVEKKELPALAPGTMVYMMSKQQYLNDTGTSWHPHVMFYASGDAEKSWGANQPGSPVMAAYDPELRVTTFFVVVGEWSDGTPGPPIEH